MAQNDLREFMNREAAAIDRQIEETVSLLPDPVRPVCGHVLKAGGKRVRPVLTILFARLFGYAEKDIYPLATSLELLHAATLLHDDILDNAESRRGKPAAHVLYGIPQTILAGDALLAFGNYIVSSYKRPELVDCYSRATMQTAVGEIMEMASLGNVDLTHAQYIEMARNKTGCLISQACLMGALAAGANGEDAQLAAAFGENIGLAFQLVDDALDFAPLEQTGKPAGGDLREGKMTPPLRFYRQNLTDGQKAAFDRAFAQKAFSPDETKIIIEAVLVHVPETLRLAEDCIGKAKKILEQLPPGPESHLLRQVADYVLSRNN